MASTEMSPQARSPWVILEWFYKAFASRATEPPAEFGVAVSLFNIDTREYRRSAVRMAWPPTPDRMAMARRRLWEWIGRLESDEIQLKESRCDQELAIHDGLPLGTDSTWSRATQGRPGT